MANAITSFATITAGVVTLVLWTALRGQPLRWAHAYLWILLTGIPTLGMHGYGEPTASASHSYWIVADTGSNLILAWALQVAVLGDFWPRLQLRVAVASLLLNLIAIGKMVHENFFAVARLHLIPLGDFGGFYAGEVMLIVDSVLVVSLLYLARPRIAPMAKPLLSITALMFLIGLGLATADNQEIGQLFGVPVLAYHALWHLVGAFGFLVLFFFNHLRFSASRASDALSGASAATLLAILLLAGCGDDKGGAAAIDPGPVAGTAVRFDLDADLLQPGSFYDLPYPSDLRLDGEGRVSHVGFPNRGGVLSSVLQLADERRFWPTTPFAFFRFDAPLAPRRADDWIAATTDGPVLLIGIEPGSRDYARLWPTIASTQPADRYTPEHLLAVAVPPGVVLSPNSVYAFVVLRSLLDAEGHLLGVPASFAALRAGETPGGALGPRATEAYAPLWPALRRAGVDVADVAAATVFTTTDVAADLAALSDALRARHQVAIQNLHVDSDDGADHDRFCEIHGAAIMPMFQRGIPNYNSDGRFQYGQDGLPIVQRNEAVPLTITLPRTPMPDGGFPLVLYFHGTGGAFDQVVDRGAVTVPGGEPRKGEGPAHVLAAHGLATFQAALPLNPDRYDGPVGLSQRSYLNINNLGAYPDTFRQMTIEQRLLLDALGRLEISPDVVAECDLEAPPAEAFVLRTDRVAALGQSLGGQVVNMVGAVDRRVVAIVPTGSGGYWSYTILAAEFAPGIPAGPAVALLLGVATVQDHLHPALQLVQSTFEAAEPLVFARRVAVDPLTGHPSRSIYQPIGIDDPGFPNPVYAAMALASGTQHVGSDLHPSLQQALSLGDLDGIRPYDVSGNRMSRARTRYTAAVVQYLGDGILSSHHIFSQLDDVKFQYGCFLRSIFDGGPGIVQAPAPPASGCSAPR
jgi:hypothetical protein